VASHDRSSRGRSSSLRGGVVDDRLLYKRLHRAVFELPLQEQRGAIAFAKA
jgi:hypothetical protein